MSDFAQLQYICPNCFSQKTVNDVLFCRNAVKAKPDYRKRYFWHVLHPRLDGPENARCFADWRTYPANQRLLREKIVLGVTDYAGDTLTQRVCPECHYPTANPWDLTLLLLPWTETGVDCGRGMEFFNALGQSKHGWQVDMLQADPEQALMPYVRAAFADTFMQLPIGLIDGDRVLDEGLLTRYVQASSAAIVWLKLDPADCGEAAADLEAIRVLLDLSEIGGSRGDGIERPTVIFLDADETLPEQPLELKQWLEERHHNLLNALNMLFMRFCTFVWHENYAETAEKAAGWLLQTSFEGQWPTGVSAEPKSYDTPVDVPLQEKCPAKSKT